MKFSHALAGTLLLATLAPVGAAYAGSGNRITANLVSVDVIDHGRVVAISRSADHSKLIPKPYRKAGRHCPPFCVQPMHILPGVETIGELEVLGYLKRMANGDRSVLVVDSRTPDWIMRGTIPGAVNIPWNKLNTDVDGTFAIEAEAETLGEILEQEFAAKPSNNGWDFSNAKTLVLFCNGLWCPQSSINIKTLARMGYPPQKLKWYRGGMQDWVSVGLTTVRP